MEHELDDDGQPIHVDIDPYIPTGRCAICIGREQTEGEPD